MKEVMFYLNGILMSINYSWYRNPQREEGDITEGLHPRPFFNGTVDTRQLAKEIEKATSLTEGDVKATLTALSRVVAHKLAMGEQVHLEGLGYFTPTLTTEGRVTEEMSLRERSRKVRFKGISFRPDSELQSHMGPINFSYVNRGESSGLPTDEEIEAKLTTYFSTQAYLTRRKLETLFGIRTTTAVRLLRRLLDEDFLKNDGTRQQPIYLPVPGHFGK